MTDPRNGLVQLNGPGGPVGVGFVVGPRMVVTCHHLLERLPGVVAEGSQVSVTFFADGRPRTANVVLDSPSEDVVVLHVPRPAALPSKLLTMRLVESRDRAQVDLFGYPADRPAGSWNESTVSGYDDRGRLQLNSTGGSPLQPGFSGTPVIVPDTGQVMGMLVETSGTGGHSNARAVSTRTIKALLPRVRPLDRLEPRVLALGTALSGLFTRRGRWVAGATATALVAVAAYLIGNGGLPVPGTGDCVVLNTTVSTEKDELVAELAKDFENGLGVTDRCIDVRVTGLTSGVAATAIANDWQHEDPAVTVENEPDVWLPTSSMSVDQVAAEAPNAVPAAGRLGTVTSSVLAIAVPTADKDELFPEGSEDWDRLRELATEPGFVLGRDNPHNSTSGLAATVAAYYAGMTSAGQGAAVDPDDPDWAAVEELVDDAEVGRFVHGIEQSVQRYGLEATGFMQEIYDEGQGGGADGERPVNAVVVQEQLIHLYNCNVPGGGQISDLQCGNPPELPLTAVYPTEGSLGLDHPFVVLGQPSADVRDAAQAFYDYLRDPAAQAKFTELGFRGADDPAHPTPTLEDSLGILPGQQHVVLPTPPADVLSRMLETWVGIQRRANVTLVIDVSGSMGDSAGPGGSAKIDLAKDAATLGLGMLTPDDRLGITVFSDEVREVLPLTNLDDAVALPPCEPGRTGGCVDADCDDVPAADLRGCLVDALEPDGNTALYEAVTTAFGQAHDGHEADRINAVVVLSDGEETQNQDGLDELLAHLRDPNLNNDDQRVQVYTVAYGADAEAATEALRNIAGASGGTFYDATSAQDIGEVMIDVFANFGGEEPES